MVEVLRRPKFGAGLIDTPSTEEPTLPIPKVFKPSTEVSQSSLTPTGFIKNLFRQGEQIVTAPYHIAKAVYGKLSSMTADDWEDTLKNPDRIATGAWGFTKKMLSAIAGPDSGYAKHGLRVLYEEPLTPVLDAMALLTLGGATAAKTGQLMGRVASLSSIGKKLEAAGTAARLIPRKIEQAVTNSIFRAVGINPATRRAEQALRRERNALMDGAVSSHFSDVRNITKGMKEDGWREFHEGVVFGADSFSNKQAARLYGWYEGYSSGREGEIVRRGVKTAEQLENVKLRKLVSNLREIGIDVSKEEAKAFRNRRKFKSLYSPAEYDKKFTLEDLVDAPETLAGRKVIGILEPYRKGKSMGDPRQWLPRTVRAWEEAARDFGYFDGLVSEGLLVAAREGAEALTIKNPFVRQYVANDLLAKSAEVRALRKTAREQRIRNVFKDMEASGLSPERVTKIKNLAAVDSTIRNIISFRYKSATGLFGRLLRGYDNIIGTLKKAFTIFNPSFYTGNLVGDAIFMSLAGTLGIRGSEARKIARAIAPAELQKTGLGFATELAERGTLGRVAERGAEAVRLIDSFAANRIFTRFQSDAMKRVVGSFDGTMASLAKAVAEYNKSPQTVRALLERTLALDQRVAGQLVDLRAIEKEMSPTTQTVDRLTGNINRLEKRLLVLEKHANRAAAVRTIENELRATAKGAQQAARLLAERAPLQGRVDLLERQLIQRGGPFINVERIRDLTQKMREVFMQAYRKINSITWQPGKKASFEGLKSQLNRWKANLDEAEFLVQGYEAAARGLRRSVSSSIRRADALEQDLPNLLKMREVTRESIRDSLSFIGDYNGLGPIEQGVMRRLVPFYAFMKAMSLLAFRLPFIAPGRAAVWAHLSQFMSSVADDADLPDWMRNYFPVGVTVDERGEPQTVWVALNNTLPAAALRPARIANVPVPRLLAFWENNPIITVGLRLLGARTEFFWAGKPKAGQLFVPLSTGEVARFTGSGKIETVVPQEELTDALLGIVPAVRQIQQLLTPYDINKGPRVNPDGSWRYPVESWQALLRAIGVSTKVDSKEAILKRQRRFVNYIFKTLRFQSRQMTPEDREEVRQIVDMKRRGLFSTLED